MLKGRTCEMYLLLEPEIKSPSASSVPSTLNLLEVTGEGLLGPLPPCCCLTALSAVQVTLWQRRQVKGESSWRDGHRATCPGTGLVLGDRVGTAATLRCNFAAFYLKTALSQEK